MLEINITISDALADQIDNQSFEELFEQKVKKTIGSISKVKFLRNKADESNSIWVTGIILPDCDGETEIPNQIYLNLFLDIGLTIQKTQKLYKELEIIPVVYFSGV